MGTIRKFNLKEIKEKTGINVFVETGTLYGDGTDYALDAGFKKIISIEIDKSLAEQAKAKYKHNSNVEIVEGNSASIIQQLCEQITEPIVFWLDAHFPGADAGLSSHMTEKDYNTRVPLEAELTAIHKRKQKDIIICDDLWMYEDGNYECGSFDEHSKRHGHNTTRQQVCGHNLNGFYEAFSDTHNIKKYYDHQGYVVFLPRS